MANWRRTLRILALVLAPALACGTVEALEGADGSTVTALFTVSDVAASVEYPPGFAGVPWGDLDALAFGSPGGSGGYEQSDDVASNAAGTVFLLVYGSDVGSDALYSGLVAWDGVGFTHLLQDERVGEGTETLGDELRTVEVSAVTAGRLTAGHPVVTRHHKVVVDEVQLEVWSVDPTSGEQTFVHGWTGAALNPEAFLAIGADGSIYAMGAIPGGPGAVRKLVWNGATAAYDETFLTGNDYGGGMQIGPEGFLYTFAKADAWQVLTWPYDDHQVFRVDPVTGAANPWAHVDGDSFIFDWTWSDDGKLWIGLRERKLRKKHTPRRYIAEVTAGGTADAGGRVSDSDFDPESLAPAPNGGLYVVERRHDPLGTVYLLEPGEGSGGGGKGNGKGKNK